MRLSIIFIFFCFFPSSLATFVVAQALPECRYDDVLTAYDGLEQWQFSLLDTIYMLPAEYIPEDLVRIDDSLSPDKPRQLRAIVLEDLYALAEAAREAGYPIAIQSAYRSYDYQQFTFNYWVDTIGMQKALHTSARAGHSEHQLGTVIDVRELQGAAAWDFDDWAETETGAWMLANSWKYGFVLSYPQGREATTCYAYEPWHYRYMGREIARQIYDLDITLREWLWTQQP